MSPRITRPLPLLVALLALGLAPSRAQEAAPARAQAFEGRLVDLAERVRARTVLVYGLVGLGSGAVVTHDGLVVTNAHVVAAAPYALLQWADGTTVSARRLGIDYGRDLAVLEPSEPLKAPVPAFSLGTAPLRAGQWVMAAGFPGGLRTTPAPTLSLGRIEGKGNGEKNPLGFLDYSQAWRSDVPIFSGNSGGPLVDLDGRLVGINGAVDIAQATSLTIPADVVAERLQALRGGVIVLPSGQVLDPRRNALLRRFHELLDPMLKQLPERVAEGSRQAAQAGRDLRERVDLPALPVPYEPNDRLADIARKKPRQEVLARMLQRAAPGALVAEGGVWLTQVDPQHVVCKASLLPEGQDTLQLGGGASARVIARSGPDDLALVRLPAETTARPQDAPHRPVGSLVTVRGPDGVLAAGIVSAAPRPTSATVLASIQQSGIPPLLRGALELLERIPPLRELAEQIRQSIEARGLFAAGTPPRSYREVLSIDAPLPPSMVGAPAYDLEGRLLGPTIGVAHHGTSYVVPMPRVRQAFAAHLRGPVVPEKVGEAKAY